MQNSYGRRLGGGVALVSLSMLMGCTPSPFDASVDGTITLDGQPVKPGVVIFSPSDGSRNSSRGNIDTEGHYELVTKHALGIDSGNYRVGVRVFEKGEPPGPGERAAANPPPLVPEKYLSVATSGLEYEVTPGSNTINIELTSD